LSQPNAPPPVPLGAYWDQEHQILQIGFDRWLQTATLAASNWSMIFEGDRWEAAEASSAAESVYCPMVSFNSPGGPNRVDYLATPPDVISALGTPAAAFSDFPLTPV